MKFRSSREQPDVDVTSILHTATVRSRNAVAEVKPLESLAILGLSGFDENSK